MGQPTSLFNTRSSDAAGEPTNGASMTGTSTVYSLPMSASRAAYWSVHLVWSGTPNGTFTLWTSDVPQPSLADDTDWVQDTSFSPTNPAGSAGKMMDFVGNGACRWWRIKYVNSSSTGTLKGYASVAQHTKG